MNGHRSPSSRGWLAQFRQAICREATPAGGISTVIGSSVGHRRTFGEIIRVLTPAASRTWVDVRLAEREVEHRRSLGYRPGLNLKFSDSGRRRRGRVGCRRPTRGSIRMRTAGAPACGQSSRQHEAPRARLRPCTESEAFCSAPSIVVGRSAAARSTSAPTLAAFMLPVTHLHVPHRSGARDQARARTHRASFHPTVVVSYAFLPQPGGHDA